MAKDQQQYKEEETKSLIQLADDNHLWVENINIDLYVSQGAEIPDSIQAFSPTWFAEQVLSSAG